MSEQDSYLIPALAPGKFHRTEITIKKSVFITSVARTAGVEAARAFIAEISAEFKDARHNCFAFVADKPGSTAYAGCSDDGEPRGTAGRPMLNVLLHSGAGEITAVVTRYFGGVLLGTGGLVKAYQDSVKGALETLTLTPKVPAQCVTVILPPKFISACLRLCERCDVMIMGQRVGAEAEYKLCVPLSQRDFLFKSLSEITSGQARILSTAITT